MSKQYVTKKSTVTTKGEKLCLGDTVTNAGKTGVIHYIGDTEFASGEWMGLVLDDPVGKNDGSVNDIRYFDCAPKHGLFVKPLVAKLVKAGPGSIEGKTPSKKSTSTDVKDAPKTPAAAPAPEPKSAPPKENEAPKVAASPSPASPPPATRQEAQAALAEKQTTKQKVSRKDDTPQTRAASTSDAADRKDRSDSDKQLTDLQTELTKCKRDLQNTKGDLVAAKERIKELEQKSHKDEDEPNADQLMVEQLTVDKQLLEEQKSELEVELKTAQDELKSTKEELENLRDQADNKAKETIESLPSDQGEILKIQEQNKKLTVMLRKLRDQLLSKEEAFKEQKENLERELKETRVQAAEFKNIKPKFEAYQKEISDLKGQLDETRELQEMVESLSEKNVELNDTVGNLKTTIEQLKEEVEADKEVELAHQELEKRLQSDLDHKETEFNQLQLQLQVKQQRIDDLTKTVRQFRELRQGEEENPKKEAATAASAAVVASPSKNADVARKLRAEAAQTQARFRAKVLQHQLARMEWQQTQRRVAFLQNYLPENIQPDERSLALVQLMERLKFKTQLLISVCDDHYGATASILSEELATFAYKACNLLVDVARAVEVVIQGTASADAEALGGAFSRVSDITGCETTLDNFLNRVAKDMLTEQTTLDPLSECAAALNKYALTFFFPAPDNKTVGKPLPVTISYDAQQVYYNQVSTRVMFQALSDIVANVAEQKAHATPAPTGKGASASAAHEEPKFVKLFRDFEDAQMTNQQLSAEIVGKAQAYQQKLDKKATAATQPNPFTDLIITANKHGANVHRQITSLVSKCKTYMAQQAPPEVKDPKAKAQPASNPAAMADWLAKQFEALLVQEQKDGMAKELQLVRNALQDLSNRLTTDIQPAAAALGPKAFLSAVIGEISGGGAATAADTTPKLWERHSVGVRQQLKEAASVRGQLDEAERKLRDKTQEIFNIQKDQREGKALLDMWQLKVRQLEQDKATSGDIREELVKAQRDARDHQQALDVANKDVERLTRDKQELKRKVEKLKAEGAKTLSTPAQVAEREDERSEKATKEEVILLTRTIKMLRGQMAEVQARQARDEMERSLPPLPNVRNMKVHVATHHTEAQNIAMATARSQLLEGVATQVKGDGKTDEKLTINVQANPDFKDSLLSPSLVSPGPRRSAKEEKDREVAEKFQRDVNTVMELQHGIRKVHRKLVDLRVAPLLVDLSGASSSSVAPVPASTPAKKETKEAKDKKETAPPASASSATPVAAGQTWLSRRTQAVQLKKESAMLMGKLQTFIANKRAEQQFTKTALASNIPRVETAVKIADEDVTKLRAKLVARVSLPGSEADSSKVLINREHLSKLHHAFLP